MGATRYRAVKDILAAALEVRDAERAAYLDQACGGDEALRREVDELLALERTVDEAMPVDDAMRAGQNPRSLTETTTIVADAQTIGPYRILELLGRGGMGVVYRAEQTRPVERQVALKVVATPLLDATTRLRFHAERQALARLSHPNIARLYDAGDTADGSPYFAMELVEGRPLTRFADAERLDLRRRLELLLEICDGVAHAHQKGVLHRDLKPSNLLVEGGTGERATAKIIDFGIAKALDRPLVEATLLTGDRVLGTPAYMSPESVDDATRADTRSDVYSLGVILYELLVGVRPLDDADPRRLLERIVRDEPKRPSTRWRRLEESTRETSAEERGLEPVAVLRALHGDLDWIVMRAIAKDPDRRYQSVRELADDLERYLRAEPVEARPPTLAYRFSRLVRRHRLAVGAAALIVLSLAAGVVGITVGLLRARAEAEAARQAQAEAEAVSEYMIELFRLASPEETSGEDVTAADLLSRGGELADERFADQPLAHARFLNAIAMSYQHLGLDAEAASHLRTSLEILEPRRGDEPRAYLDALTTLTKSLVRMGERDEAVALQERARDSLDSDLGLEPSTEAEMLQRLGFEFAESGRFDEARELIARSLAIYDEAAEETDAAIRALDKLGVVESVAGNHEEAARLHRLAAERAEALHGPRHVVVATALMNLGASYSAMGRYEESLEVARRALEIRRHIYGDTHREIVPVLSNVAINLFLLGHFDEAREALEEARRILTGLGDENSPLLAKIGVILAHAEYRLGHHAAATEAFASSLAAEEEIFEPGHPQVEMTRSSYGVALARLGRLEDSRRHLETAAVHLGPLGPDHELVAMSHKHLAVLERLSGRLGEARERFEQALDILTRTQAPDHPMLVDSRAELGDLLVEMGRLEEAEPLIAEALQRRLDALGGEHPQVAESLESRARLELARGELEAAEETLRRALAIREAVQGDDHPEIVRSLGLLARHAEAAGRPDRARELRRRALDLAERREVPELWLRDVRESAAVDPLDGES